MVGLLLRADRNRSRRGSSGGVLEVPEFEAWPENDSLQGQ